MGLNTKQRKQIEDILKLNDYIKYKWIDPKKIIVSQWVRMKCKFGCGEYGRGGTCPPETPSVAECKEFFNEYGDTVILPFPIYLIFNHEAEKFVYVKCGVLLCLKS